jgi:hypothetical protein
MSKHSRWSDLDEQCVLAYKRASSGSGSCPPAGVIHPICQYERFGNRALFGLSEGPDYLIVYLSELRFINPRADTSEF